jgi:hypothetical protein
MSRTDDAASGCGQDGIPEAGLPQASSSSGKDKIDRETARAEFVSYCEENDIDCNMDAMTDEEKKDFKPIMDRFIKACVRGRVEADGVNLEIYHFRFFKRSCGESDNDQAPGRPRLYRNGRLQGNAVGPPHERIFVRHDRPGGGFLYEN